MSEQNEVTSLALEVAKELPNMPLVQIARVLAVVESKLKQGAVNDKVSANAFKSNQA